MTKPEKEKSVKFNHPPRSEFLSDEGYRLYQAEYKAHQRKVAGLVLVIGALLVGLVGVGTLWLLNR